ncbi:Xpo1-domain-containing protein [Rozella allomycis CSF55]|uniref:Exportin-T n=1 Tax=Rozella allomycis (strain CSF55) TaxID=988480 RepID=A0A075AQL4_ROZAC|nr:Exportin-1/Importin-beta-like domain-containing protein [Rozella allomycis CSF55]RKP17340.1 Xpo1-domain-containing protein [Rozella allomycis CSF55]|eukprot:EPZ30882.1 Exportin-1/Importin-beta-like domain-containing protein [Rozella allomycis CSF55]
METLEQAVLCSLNAVPASAEIRQQAYDYCEDVKKSPEGWKLGLELFLRQPRTFFCLQLLEHAIKYKVVCGSELSGLRGEMMGEIGGWDELDVKNKLVQVVGLMFEGEYLTSWPNFFKDMIYLVQSANQTHVYEFYLRLCLSIDEEVVTTAGGRAEEAEAHQRHTMLKDQMRVNDMRDLVESWIGIMMSHFVSGRKEIVNLCVRLLGRYSYWADINLILNERVLRELMVYMDDMELQESVIECISMIEEDKFAVIEMINIPMMLSKIKGWEDVDEAIKIAKFINIVGSEMCGLSVIGSLKVFYACQSLFPFAMRAFSHEYDDVVCEILPFISSFLYVLKKIKKENGVVPEQLISNVETMFKITIVKMKREMEEASEEEFAMFQEFRKSLRVIFDGLISVEEEECFMILESFIQNCKGGWNEGEVVFYTLLIYTERKNLEGLKNDSRLINILTFVLSIQISNQFVFIPYFDLINRITTIGFFELKPDCIQIVLERFFIEGIMNPHPFVSERAIYLFHRFIKHLKSKLILFVDEIIRGLLPIVHANRTVSNYLLESLGILVSLKPSQEQVNLMNLIFNPFQNQISSLISSNDQQEKISTLISYYGDFSKNVGTVKDNQVLNLITNWIQLLIATLNSLVESESIRKSTLKSFQKITLAINEAAIPFIPTILKPILIHCSIQELSDIFPIVSLFLNKYKNTLIDIINEFLPFLNSKAFSFMATPIEGTDDLFNLRTLRRNFLSFQIALISFDFHILLHNQFNQTLSSTLTICQDNQDPISQKQAFTFLLKVVTLLDSVSGVDDFIINQITPLIYSVPLQNSFNFDDASSMAVLLQISILQKCILEKKGDNYAQYLLNNFFSFNFGLDYNISLEYIQAMKALDAKGFSKVFHNFIKVLKSRNTQ